MRLQAASALEGGVEGGKLHKLTKLSMLLQPLPNRYESFVSVRQRLEEH